MQISIENMLLQFRERATHLEAVDTPHSLNTPLEWLAGWITLNREKLTEEDMVVLCSIGAMIHREKLIKESTSRSRKR
ncbi:hypothetical protein G7048_24260 [Diaphorobacter sp. HDW4B]|uniref:hypothetical protein n=1 Tax=Diaphorobacter sp. HDW4B TaxID=2714925 RepID=UPI00140B4A13|nr:hypothetical protein [Diaphorobacter sp. HDW4B]QIL73190.1 hypothetical protein G7048_24260 [Diaphorobacter sp. HDW4B]